MNGITFQALSGIFTIHTWLAARLWNISILHLFTHGKAGIDGPRNGINAKRMDDHLIKHEDWKEHPPFWIVCKQKELY